MRGFIDLALLVPVHTSSYLQIAQPPLHVDLLELSQVILPFISSSPHVEFIFFYVPEGSLGALFL